MKTATILLTTFITLSAMSCSQPKGTKDYLKTVLDNLEEIQSATYYSRVETWHPGDTAVVYDLTYFIREYDNPSDTTIGAIEIQTSADNHSHLCYAYDGKMKASVFEEHKGIMIDSFKVDRNLPFRPVGPPFYNYTKSILRYILTTKDSITLEKRGNENTFHLKLTIHEDRQVEFFGRAYKIPDPPFRDEDPTSRYEIWIDKKTNLPYKYRREMSHNISAETVSDATFNNNKIEDVDVTGYFPEGYEIRYYGDKKKTSGDDVDNLIGNPAPGWTLTQTDGQEISLNNDTGKVVLLQFTSAGCGPCRASVPFLNKLTQEYPNADFVFYAIELTCKNISGVQAYKKRVNAGFNFLHGTEAVRDAYGIQAFPVFILMDKNHIVHKRITGYQASVDNEIRGLIHGLLK